MLDLANSISKIPVLHKVIFFISLLILFMSIPFEVNVYDEGLALTGAMMVKYGLIPYKDFWTIYAPGQFYLNALVLKFFPGSIFAVRMVSFIFFTYIGLIIYNISERTLNQKVAIIPTSLAFILISYTDLWSRAIPSALFFVFISVYYLFNYFETAKIKYAVYSGFAIGLTALFRHDMGGFLLGAIFQAVFFFSLSHGIVRDADRKTKIWYGLKNALKFGVAAFWVLPVAIYFLVNVPFADIWNQLIAIPATTFREFRSLPFPYPWDFFNGVSVSNSIKLLWTGIAFWVPVLTAISTVILIILRVKRKTLILNGEKFWKEITLFNIVLNLFNQASVRSDFEHTISVYLAALILLVNMILLLDNKLLRNSLLGFAYIFLASVPIIALFKNYSEKSIKQEYVEQSHYSKTSYPVELEEYLNYVDLKNSLKNIFRVDPDATFFSCNTRHDNIYINNNLIYFEMNKIPPTKYFELHPGVATEEKVQRSIALDLEQNKVDYIVMTEMPFNDEDNESSKTKGATYLDDYIRAFFELIYEHDKYSIWKRSIE